MAGFDVSGSAIFALAAGNVSGDLGTRLALGYPPRLTAWTWVLVGSALIAAVAQFGGFMG